MDQLLRFLERHLLHLAEATILLSGWTPLVDMLEVLLRSFADNEECPLMQFLHAARHFMVQNSPVVYLYPLQLYASALVFEPDSSLIKRALVADIPCWLDLAPRTEETPGDPGQFVDESLIAGHTGPVLALAFSPDGRLAASGSSDHTAAMWNTQTGTVRHKLRDHATRICHVVFSPDGQLLASGAADHSVRLWDTRTGRLRHTLICTGRPRAPRDPYDGGMIRVVFSPDGRTLAVEICDERVWLWDVVTGFLRLTVDCHDGESRALAFSPDGRRVTSGSKDHSIQMWDVATGVLQKTLQGHEICIIDVAFSRDGRRLVSVGGDLTVRLWDTETGALQRTLRDFVNQPQPRAVGFSPDGRLVALGGEDGCLYIWDAGSGKLLQKVPLGPVENTLLIGGASGCSSYIETDVGCVDIRRWLPGDASPYPEVYRQDLWIMYQGRREMRLPDRYRRPQASAYRDGILALGYDSGRVIFLGFGKE
ncbi:WD40 repeat-like protein [Aspergillus campestris IBT 28561]|uniref:WD40 repeat-like protein n=1 Tax=Aspergillus campestris (strain IBT 28561) TaxID=1392248 RepID=A0A2I1D491_ASPC2|nr:WD40 repeat-like protein [Aspergillus campestris IBT 28561]PKY04694.1 WD40 repeat-like protein [Aspergillus campestris IBT 28561]